MRLLLQGSSIFVNLIGKFTPHLPKMTSFKIVSAADFRQEHIHCTKHITGKKQDFILWSV